MRSTPSFTVPSNAPNLVAGRRYQLLERLAQGGMGEVFAARDTGSGGKVALKRLLPEHRQREALFRAEYHALARLQHPHIIRVFEYGLDRGAPYYTMELLDGQDLLETPLTGYRECCRAVRDVASSLALLHAQRLLHRDVSPRNVRRTSTGACKLIDFGMMVPFGVPPNSAGTLPFVSPEAWEGSVLDQRSDLYSLGALAYWLITRKLPLEPKSIGQNGTFPETPPQRMRKSVPSVPPALDDLVLSLLELDPAKRPTSAAEVILRLNQIAELEPDDSIELAQSYLSSGRFVGRHEELEVVDEALRGALEEKRGGSLLVAGVAGIGRTRFLQEVALLAQTRGVRVVRAFGSGLGTTELAREIYRGFRRSAPDAYKLLDYRDQATVRQLDRAARDANHTSTPEGRAKLHAALSAYAHAATSEGAWVVLIDDLDTADNFSASFVASLAREAETRQLLVIASSSDTDARRVTAGNASTELFARHAGRITLRALDLDATRALASSLFGAVPNLERLVDWLYRGARGHPGLTMELASLLLRRGAIRYVEGAFSLPQDEIDESVPADLARALALRLDPLSAGARKLADLVAVRRGSTSLELCLATSELAPEDTLSALEELVRHGILMAVRGDHAFAQEAMREAVRMSLAPEREKSLHRRLADALLSAPQADLESRLEAAWHLVHTEEELAGADVLAEVTPPLIESGLAYAAAISAAEKALEVYERRGATLEKRLAVRSVLVRAGYLYDYELARRYGQDTVDALYEWSNLGRVTQVFGTLIGLGLMLVMTFLRRLFSPKAKRGPSPYLTMQYLCRSLVSLLGVRALSLDGPAAEALLAKIEPLNKAPSFTSGRHVYLTARALALQPFGREPEVKRAAGEALAYLRAHRIRDMAETERQDMCTGLMLSAGINECYRAGSEALAHADALEGMGTPLARAAAQRIRLTYHMIRGGREEAERHRRMLDIHAIQGGTTWQVEWFAVPVEGLASARLGDLVSARRSLERLEELVEEVPSLGRMRDMLQLMYQHKRGNLELAKALGEKFVAACPMRTIIGWASGYAAFAATLNDLGEYERAKELCEQANAAISDADREYCVVYGGIDRELAYSCAALGDHARADEIGRSNLLRYEAAREYAWLCAEHQNRARIAQLRGDREAVVEAVKQMREAAKRSNSRFLIEMTARNGASMLRANTSSEHPPADVEGDLPFSPSIFNTPVRGLTRSKARNALRRAMEQADASSAFLYVLTDEGLKLAASTGAEAAPSPVVSRVSSLVETDAPGRVVMPSGVRVESVAWDAQHYELLLLPRRHEQMRPTVLALELSGERASRDLPPSVLDRLAEWTLEHG